MQRWKQRGDPDKYGVWSKLAPHGDRIRALVMDITDELCVGRRGDRGEALDAWRLSSAGAESQKKTAHAAEQERPCGGASHLAQRAWADCRTAGLSDDLGADEHSGHRAARPPWPLEDNHVHCRPASTPDHRALRFRGPINGASFLACPASPGPALSRAGQPLLPQGRGVHEAIERSAQPRSTCRPTAPISIPSNRSSPAPFSARSAPEPSMTSRAIGNGLEVSNRMRNLRRLNRMCSSRATTNRCEEPVRAC